MSKLLRYSTRAFEEALQKYGRHSNANRSKLNSIGPENVYIKEVPITETDPPRLKKKYNVKFKTKRGKEINLELLDYSDDELYLTQLEHSLNRSHNMDYLLNIKQKMQIAIGQMPEEIFKRLKSISIEPLIKASGDVGQEPVKGAIGTLKKSKITGKWVKQYLFGKPPLLINASVVDAWMRVTQRTSSRMRLKPNSLGNIGVRGKMEWGLIGTLAHELGHVLHIKRFGTPDPGKNWLRAIRRDGTSVSNYGDTKPTEDFAEAMRVYIQTDGGTKDPQAMRDFANRFEIIDKLMKKDMQERASLFNKFKRAMERRGVAFVTRAGVLTHVVVENNVHIIPPEGENTASVQEQ